MERPEWEKHSGAMGEKVCLITGATSGIGKATAMGLATLGASDVMVGRDRGKSERSWPKSKRRAATPRWTLCWLTFLLKRRYVG
jgi:NAD(P)-dependent dehydrogenase (short-subunit alcohol dehydrogenase family)